MKLGLKVYFLIIMILSGIVSSSVTLAEEDLTSSFSINEPYQPNITPAMLAKYRSQAMAHLPDLLQNPADPSDGSPLATVILVEFMDFKCPQSKRMDPYIQDLVSNNPSFRVIYKIIPIHGTISIYAAKAALAANRQGKYLPYHRALMQAGNTLTEEKVIAIAKSQGIDIPQLKTDMKSLAIKQQLETNMKLFHTIGLLGTPGLFFVKYNITSHSPKNAMVLLLGLFSQPELQNIIDRLLT